MPVNNVGAIYATNSKLLQRIYIPDADDSEIFQQPVASGESLQLVPLSNYRSGGIDAVQAAIGTPTFSGRCAVVNPQNQVVDVIMADPTLYSDPRGTVVPHDRAKHGDIWDGTNFSRSYTEFSPSNAVIAAIKNQVINNPIPANVTNKIMTTPPNALPGGTAPYPSWKWK